MSTRVRARQSSLKPGPQEQHLEQSEATQEREDRRPPLGPNAVKNLSLFGLFTALHTIFTVIFSAALASLIARAAYAGYDALFAQHQAAKDSHSVTYYRAFIEFAGDGRASLDGTLGWLLGTDTGLSLSLVIIAVLALILRSACDYMLSISAQRAATGAKSTIRRALIERVLATGGADTPEGTGATSVLISRGLNTLDDYYTKTLTAMVGCMVIPLTLGLIVLSLDVTSAVVLVCTLPLIPIFMILIGKTTREDTAAAQRDLHRLSDHIMELVRGLPVLIGLGRERSQSRALDALGQSYRQRTMHTLRSAFMSSLALELITTISVALVAVLIGVRLVNGTLGLDTGILVLLLVPECYQPLRDVGAAYHQSEDGVAALRSAQKIIDAPLPTPLEGTAPDTVESAEPFSTETPAHKSLTVESLSVESLSVQYPGRGHVFDNLSLRIPRTATAAVGGKSGALVGIVGPSGCGKSTLLQVLSGYVAQGLVPTGADDPEQVTGRVEGLGQTLLIAQSPVFAAPTVAQEMYLYTLSASEEQRERAAALLTGTVSAHETERELIAGYLERVGLGGLENLSPDALSAGQARRLAVARVLGRVDALQSVSHAPLTVLVDEPTAHLDQHAALLVTSALGALRAQGALVLLVTHEAQLAEHCDYLVTAVQTAGVQAASAQGAETQDYSWSVSAGSARALPAAPADMSAVQDIAIHGMPVQTSSQEAAQESKNLVKHGVLSTLKTLRAMTGISAFKALGPICLAALTSLSAAALTALSGWLIVRAAEQPAMMYLMVAIVGVRFFGLGRACARYAERLASHSQVLRAANTLRLRAWKGAYRSGSSVRSLLRGDALLEKLINGIDELRDGIPRVILPPAAHLLVMIAAISASAAVIPQALAPVVIAAVLTTLVIPVLVLCADAHAEQTGRESTASLMRAASGALSSAEDIRANGLNSTVLRALGSLDTLNVRALSRGSYAQGLGRALVTISWFGAALWTAAIAYPLAVEGTVGAPESAIIVLMCTGMLESSLLHTEAIRSWPAFAALVHSIAPQVEGIELEESDRAVLAPEYSWAVSDKKRAKYERAQQEADKPASPSAAQLLRDRANTLPVGSTVLAMENGSARWAGMEHPVFEHLNITARTGSWTGITGPSGSGKSTALATLLGFLPLETGIMSAASGEVSAEQLRGYAAWCPQAAHIFESTLAGNLSLARDRSERPSEEEMITVLRRVGLGPWFDTLPLGLATAVGSSGSFLSGGQRQRLAVARALLVDSPVLLLDEPTAHLDSESARSLMSDIAAATDGQKLATVLVSHRPEDIERCDRVVSLA
ncbi:MAG: thiol reductant ABC exporter subunit CydC [Rothia sp. (in: high G+C Gram-positive bacteria)]|uniref:thiol reductant ABC exporter subunit CydC n=1 Tax=Rothia sp. (in: high G+C Gram-positive bacteria) TaxID=1885016 RepID=UPI0026DFF1EF|nr:thiol reductant ABC exporter subunit CydC [Rothia sp. (in: high G+C Gram-positive bacteria)]MDO5750810.1 thiol reductant ABC exporter subunit CydC [Rothia sp. (in: high G+C Gram-positive bacteria)]